MYVLMSDANCTCTCTLRLSSDIDVISWPLQAAIGNSRRTDDELEQLSVVREPRQRDSSPYNSTKVSEILPTE